MDLKKQSQLPVSGLRVDPQAAQESWIPAFAGMTRGLMTVRVLVKALVEKTSLS
jgi:hypothetical protein